MLSKEERLKIKAQGKAHGKVSWAVKTGVLIRPDICELCGDAPGWSHNNNRRGIPNQRPLIVAHHWNGYNNHLNVWWICASCNLILGDRHDGSMTKDQARLFVAHCRANKNRRLTPILRNALSNI